MLYRILFEIPLFWTIDYTCYKVVKSNGVCLFIKVLDNKGSQLSAKSKQNGYPIVNKTLEMNDNPIKFTVYSLATLL